MAGRITWWMVGFGVVALLGAGGCGDDGDGGGGGSAWFVNFDLDGSPTSYSGRTLAIHKITPNWTTIIGEAVAGSDPSINVTFPGAATGTFTEATGAMLGFVDSAGTWYGVRTEISGTSCTVVVTTCEPAGGLVEGTFDAIASDQAGGFVNITNGTFSVVRAPDENM